MRKITSCALLAAFMLALLPVNAAAQTVDNAGFTVRAIIPDNQIDKKQSYFDLRMSTGGTQTLQVEVQNSSREPITVDVDVRAASTNRGGVIEYQLAVPPDETLTHPFDTLTTGECAVTIPANSSKILDFPVTMPADGYDGVILGGLVFTKRPSEAASENAASILNRFSYVVGVKLSVNDTVVRPDFRLGLIRPELVNYRRAVVAHIHNPAALIVKNAAITASVYRKNDKNPLHSVSLINMDMAPNSVLPLPIEWEGREISPGDYSLSLRLVYDNQVWEWNQDFTIDGENAKDVNSGATDKVVKWWHKWWWVPVAAVAFILLLWFFFWLGRRRRDDENREASPR